MTLCLIEERAARKIERRVVADVAPSERTRAPVGVTDPVDGGAGLEAGMLGCVGESRFGKAQRYAYTLFVGAIIARSCVGVARVGPERFAQWRGKCELRAAHFHRAGDVLIATVRILRIVVADVDEIVDVARKSGEDPCDCIRSERQVTAHRKVHIAALLGLEIWIARVVLVAGDARVVELFRTRQQECGANHALHIERIGDVIATAHVPDGGFLAAAAAVVTQAACETRALERILGGAHLPKEGVDRFGFAGDGENFVARGVVLIVVAQVIFELALRCEPREGRAAIVLESPVRARGIDHDFLHRSRAILDIGVARVPIMQVTLEQHLERIADFDAQLGGGNLFVAMVVAASGSCG